MRSLYCMILVSMELYIFSYTRSDDQVIDFKSKSQECWTDATARCVRGSWNINSHLI